MSDEQLLYVVIGALYLIECAAWLPLDELAFVERGGAWRMSQPRRVFGGIRLGVVFAWPLPPLGTLLVAGSGKADPAAVRERVATYRLRSRSARVASNAVAIYLLAVAPAIATWGGLAAWPALLIGLGALTSITAALFALAHRRLYPGSRTPRISDTILVALVPTVAARAHDRLARPLLSGLHPIAAAAALCAREDFQNHARRLWREALHPRPGETSERVALEKVLRRTGTDPDALSGPPEPHAGSQSYCARCETQYVLAAGRCAECPWMELARF
jgi:hypothetical protein